MKDKNDCEIWKARWQRQILEWHEELEELVAQAQALVALIELAKSQIKSDPPE